MESFRIIGGNKLNGKLKIKTAKNAILPILAGSILIDGNVKIEDFVQYSDALNMCSIISDYGVKTNILDNTILELDCTNLCKFGTTNDLVHQIRSSIFTMGPLLGRFRKAVVSQPGGCSIGSRPIDLHLKGLKQLGVKIEEKHGYIYCDGTNMHGADIYLDFPSVGATENLMMASCCIDGITKIYNGAKEPEIVDLQNFLVKAGALIEGAGTDVITIKGVNKLLHGLNYRPIGDRIIAGTYAIAVSLTGGEVELTGFDPKHIDSLIYKLEECGVEIVTKEDGILVRSTGKLNGDICLNTLPYPGFPTDLQAQMMTLLALTKGNSVITENMFENRFKQSAELNKMGAQIRTDCRLAYITGVNRLFGADVYASDLRAGASLVIAGLVAEGYTTVHDIQHIDRGYFKIEDDLSSLGASIKRINM